MPFDFVGNPSMTTLMAARRASSLPLLTFTYIIVVYFLSTLIYLLAWYSFIRISLIFDFNKCVAKTPCQFAHDDLWFIFFFCGIMSITAQFRLHKRTSNKQYANTAIIIPFRYSLQNGFNGADSVKCDSDHIQLHAPIVRMKKSKANYKYRERGKNKTGALRNRWPHSLCLCLLPIR